MNSYKKFMWMFGIRDQNIMYNSAKDLTRKYFSNIMNIKILEGIKKKHIATVLKLDIETIF